VKTLAEVAILACAAAVAGAINAVAGGGSLVSFPMAMAVGLPPLIANATNAVALTPGSLAAALAYRREITEDRAIVRLFFPAAAGGGLAGSLLLLLTPQRFFDAIVPLLVFFATALLFAQNLRPVKPQPAGTPWHVPQRPLVALALQFLVGVYGGYFGAGMGIMMLAVFTRMGGADIHRMNGVKSVLGAAINALASVSFVLAGAIDYRAAIVMSAGSIGGGLLGAAGARRIKPSSVRWGVVAIGLVLSVSLAVRQFAPRH
jgi:uncharacterized protein